MKKFLLSIIFTLVLAFSSITLFACNKQTTIEGVFEYNSGSYTYTLYLYNSGEGYRVVTKDGSITYSYRFEYKVLEENKYIAVTWYDDKETDVEEYELIDNNHFTLDGITFVRK